MNNIHTYTITTKSNDQALVGHIEIKKWCHQNKIECVIERKGNILKVFFNTEEEAIAFKLGAM